MANPRRQASENWEDWAANPDKHPRFHYWRPDDEALAEERLGEWIYTACCLTFTALHDRGVAETLAGSRPNWSAITSYYSTVHALRLFWFAVYGGYPTRHAELGQSLRRSAGFDWPRLIPGGRREVAGAPRLIQDLVSGAAACTALKHLGVSNAATVRLGELGAAFTAACRLRNDANYESLILAHQYRHRGDANGRGVDRQFGDVPWLLRQLNDVALSLALATTEAALEQSWLGPKCDISGPDRLKVWRAYVSDKFETSGLQDLAATGLDGSRQFSSPLPPSTKAYNRLRQHARFSRFDLKRDLMFGFERKLHGFTEALQDLSDEKDR